MLVLSRKSNQSILLKELGITITVTEIKGRTVRLGITAPRSVTIVRSELPPLDTDRGHDAGSV
jgi:carbon storage regulator